mgnify:FL=1
MTTAAGKRLEISTSRHLSLISAGLMSVPSNDSANVCHLCLLLAIFLPATFQADDEEAPSKQTVREKTALHKVSTHIQGLKNRRHHRCLIVGLLTPQRSSEGIHSKRSRKAQLTKAEDSDGPAFFAIPFIL